MHSDTTDIGCCGIVDSKIVAFRGIAFYRGSVRAVAFGRSLVVEER